MHASHGSFEQTPRTLCFRYSLTLFGLCGVCFLWGWVWRGFLCPVRAKDCTSYPPQDLATSRLPDKWPDPAQGDLEGPLGTPAPGKAARGFALGAPGAIPDRARGGLHLERARGPLHLQPARGEARHPTHLGPPVRFR